MSRGSSEMVQVGTAKVIVLGAAGSGKSSLVARFVSGSYAPEYLQTFGAELYVKTSLDQKRPSLNIWIASGQERYRTLFGQFYQEVNVNDQDCSH